MIPKCADCPFAGGTVGSKGPVDSPFMIIGESPGREELKLQKPFMGPSGKVLDHALDSAQLSFPEPYITNAFACWPGHGTKNEDSVNRAAQTCRRRLLAEINAHPRKMVMCLGNAAVRSVTNDFGLKITKERGKILVPAPDIKTERALAAVHPAYILRGGGNYRQFKGDTLYALQLLNGGSPKRNPDVEYLVLDTPRLLKRLLDYAQTLPPNTLTAADIETGSPPNDPQGPGGFNHIDDSILMLGICFRPDAVYIIPEDFILHPYVRRLFQLPNLQWAWHNGKFDIKFLWSYGIPEARVDYDTMLMSYALDERRGFHDLEEVAHDWLGSPRWKHILDSHKKKNQSYRVIPKPILYQYAAYDISNTWRLVRILLPQIESDTSNALLYYRTLLPASAYLANVEDNGILVDTERVRSNEEELIASAEPHIATIRQAAANFPDHEYNDKICNSPLQLSRLLFDDLRIPSKVRSTGDEILDKLPDHPVVVALRNYRKIFKQISTYVRPHRECMASDRRIHTSFLIHGTATGRLASRNPNMMNVPRDAKIRGQFIASPGRIFLEPDLNQAELRSLAAMSGDKKLCAIYKGETNEGGVHDVMRNRMFGDPEDWTQSQLNAFVKRFFITEQDEAKRLKAILDEQKMKAKNVNFGIVYGITEFGLAEQIKGSHAEARKYLEVWRETFPEAWKFIRECMLAVRRGQNLKTVFGNRKRHHIVTQENIHALEKEAANFPHQATASHIMLHGCMANYQRYKRDYNVTFHNMMHDGSLLECPDTTELITTVVPDMVKTLEQIPRDWGIHAVPFVADCKVGYRWGRASMTDYKDWLKERTKSDAATAADKIDNPTLPTQRAA